jgi:hypothetical protein
MPFMKTRRSTQQGSIPIPIPTPTPMENMNRRIANHGLEATPKGAHQAHVGNEDDHGCSRSGCEGFNESGTGLKTRMANIRLQPGKTDGFAGSSGARIIRAATWSDDEQSIRAIRTTQLFDLQKDPAEVCNLAAHPDYAGQIGDMRRELSRWRRHSGDTEDFVVCEIKEKIT